MFLNQNQSSRRKRPEEEMVSFRTPPKNLVVHSGKMVTFEAVVAGKRPIGQYKFIQW